MNKVTISVPATTANLGAGFDVFGMALSLYNELSFELIECGDKISLEIYGEGADTLFSGDSNNLVLKSMQHLSRFYQIPLPGGILKMTNRIPLARGLGSSSAAIVGGLYLASKLLKLGLSKQELLELAVEIEGHPDNVAPALFGNCICSARGSKKWETVLYQVPEEWKWIACVPQIPLSTEDARRVLPATIEHAKAVQNVASASFFLAALIYEEPRYLPIAFRDYLHVPYRLPLIPNGEKVLAAAMSAGAYAATISGSGSTLLAICPTDKAEIVAETMKSAFGAAYDARSFILEVCTQGVHEV